MRGTRLSVHPSVKQPITQWAEPVRRTPAPQLLAGGHGGTIQRPHAAASSSAGTQKPRSNQGLACPWTFEQGWPYAFLDGISPAGTT